MLKKSITLSLIFAFTCSSTLVHPTATRNNVSKQNTVTLTEEEYIKLTTNNKFVTTIQYLLASLGCGVMGATGGALAVTSIFMADNPNKKSTAQLYGYLGGSLGYAGSLGALWFLYKALYTTFSKSPKVNKDKKVTSLIPTAVS